ncbi:MAG: radical SAM protein [Deltaproteobacteria bacterium]|nr:radical SAM protein [Deltaproteobacteria bacterium]
MSTNPRDVVRKRLQIERGTIYKDAPQRLVLVYPSPYHVAMSSLGFQTIYRQINDKPKRAAERAFLPDFDRSDKRGKATLFSYESGRPLYDFPIVAFSIAYEPELSGLVKVLQLAHIPLFWQERDQSHPFVLCGGPLTFSNPLPLSPFADAILIGEADQTIHQALDIVFDSRSRNEAREILASEIASCLVPAVHGAALRTKAVCDKAELPAFSSILTPNTELSDMFLVEGVRGCAHRCSYCVMRRSAESSMRVVPKQVVLELIPDEASRVGLVGAAISEHPDITEIIDTLASRQLEVGLSSLRPEALDLQLVTALKKAGYRTLTTALDGASQRLRDRVERNVRQDQIIQAAKLARLFNFKRLKLYVMIGLPDEEDRDIDELIDFTEELARIHPLALGVAPFVPKLNTPLSQAPFAGIRLIDDRLRRLRRAIGGKATLRSVSARWAWVEYMLAQGGPAHGRAVVKAVVKGGAFRDWKESLENAE